jgi:cytochrome c-type biogenesis protein CcmH/NrfG
MDEKADAAAGFRRAIHFDRTDVHSAMKLADLSAELGDWDAAIAAMRQAIEHDPENALAWCKLGDVLTSSMQQLEDARAAYEEAIRIRPGYVEAWTGLGEALRLLDDDGGASAALRKAEELKAHDTTGGN